MEVRTGVLLPLLLWLHHMTIQLQSEDRSIGAKYYETKFLAMFTRCAHDLTVTDRISNNMTLSTNPLVNVTQMRNLISGGTFYVTIHANSTSAMLEQFKLHVNTSSGMMTTIPQKGGVIALNGHQSKIIVMDFSFGFGHLVYPTAEVLTYNVVDGVPILAVWVSSGEVVEFMVGDAYGGPITRCQGCSAVQISTQNNAVIVALTEGVGMSVISLRDGIRALVLDRTLA